MLWRRYPVFAGGDAAAMGMILGQAVGRIGCIINGEHFAKPLDSPLAVIYTNPNSFGFGRPPTHLAVGYELVGDLVIFGICWWLLRVFKRDGLVFFTYAFLYSLFRFWVSFLREDTLAWEGLRMA